MRELNCIQYIRIGRRPAMAAHLRPTMVSRDSSKGKQPGNDMGIIAQKHVFDPLLERICG
jgi:hypothetical protein